MLRNIVKIQYNSDFTLNCKLPNGYDGQDFIIRLYTTDKDDYFEASYLNAEYSYCLTDDNNKNVVVYVNNHNLQPGCLHIGCQIDYDNTHFYDNIENIITAEETNVYLVKQNSNATSAMYVGSALPDLTGSSDFITESDLEFELLNYYTKEEIDNASYISSTDLNDYVTEEELNDMGFLSQSQLDAIGYATVSYVETKTSQKQDRLINGVNIKTVNGYSLLGNGNISISGITQDDLDNAIAPLVSQEALTETLSYYATQSFVDDAIADAMAEIVVPTYTSDLTNDSGFITETDVNNLLSTASYVTSSELSNAGYITNQDLEQTLSNATYITQNELETQLAGYVTESQLQQAGYVTSGELSNAGYATETYVSDYVAQHTQTPDLSSYVKKSELSQAGYVTGSEISQMGYITSIPTEYITETELSAKGYITSIPSEYVTETELSGMGYITSIPSEYITESEIASMGYVTESEIVGMGYVTSTELSNMGYITSSDIPTIPVIDESIIPNTTNTYTLGDSSHIYKSTYTSKLYLGSNITIAPESNAQTGSDITINLNGTQKFYLNSSRFAPNGESNNKAIDLGTSTRMWKNTYSYQYYENGTNISDKYATKTELTSKQDTLVSGTNIKTVNNNSLLGSGNITISSSGNLIAEVTTAEYEAMQQAGTLDPNTIYVITDAPATDLSYYAELTYVDTYYVSKEQLNNAGYVTQANLSNAGYLTSIPNTYATYDAISSMGYVTQTDLSNAGYLTSIPNTYATYAAISNMGYLTSANFIYDSSTYTLTISI